MFKTDLQQIGFIIFMFATAYAVTNNTKSIRTITKVIDDFIAEE